MRPIVAEPDAPQHGRPDQGDIIPDIGDSRGKPDGDGAQVVLA